MPPPKVKQTTAKKESTISPATKERKEAKRPRELRRLVTAPMAPIRRRRALGETNGVLVDNFIAEDETQILVKSDTSSIALAAKQLITEEDYSSMDYTSKCDQLHSLVWEEPRAWTGSVQKGSGAPLVVDSRGILGELKSATINFHNRSNTAIWIRGNTPKANTTSPEDISYRSTIVNKTIKPGQTCTVGVRWRNTSNDVPHIHPIRAEQTPQQIRQYARLFDFYATYPAQNQSTGETYATDAKMIDIDIAVTYSTSELYPENTKLETTKAFCLLNLKTFDNIYLVDPPVAGPYSMHSRRNLAGNPKYILPVTVGTAAAVDGVALVASSAVPATSKTVESAMIYGQAEGDFITLPYPVVVDGESYGVAAFIDGNYTAKLPDGVSQPLTGAWMLQKTYTFERLNVTTAAAKSFDIYATSGPMVVGYVPAETTKSSRYRRAAAGQRGPNRYQPQQNYQQKVQTRRVEVRSLIAVIVFFEAATKILQVISDAFRKGKKK